MCGNRPPPPPEPPPTPETELLSAFTVEDDSPEGEEAPSSSGSGDSPVARGLWLPLRRVKIAADAGCCEGEWLGLNCVEVATIIEEPDRCGGGGGGVWLWGLLPGEPPVLSSVPLRVPHPAAVWSEEASAFDERFKERLSCRRNEQQMKLMKSPVYAPTPLRLDFKGGRKGARWGLTKLSYTIKVLRV